MDVGGRMLVAGLSKPTAFILVPGQLTPQALAVWHDQDPDARAKL